MRKATAIILSALLITGRFSVQAETFFETREETQLTKGVVHTYINRYTDVGWQDIHVITADLETPFVTADILTHTDGLGNAASVLNLANQNGSIAAVNSDFFARSSWTKASTIGLAVKDGKLLSTTSKEINGAMIGVDNTGTILMDYISTDVVLTAPNGNSMTIKDINKYDDLSKPVLYTSDFLKTTGGSQNGILEVVVADGIVTEMRRDLEGVEIPENGYVIRHLPEFDPFLTENLQVGDSVALSVTTSVDISALKSACGGGTLLIKDGQKHEITHNVAGTNPRTIAGTDKSGKKLFLVTVDGRVSTSAGMTMHNLQDLALELGMYTAINLDGGGSTTMVVRDNQTGTNGVVNTPSDGSLRTVPMGLQIQSTAPAGAAETLVLKADKTTVFPGTKVKVAVDYALDEYGNPCAIPADALQFSANSGHMDNGVFTAAEPGTAEIWVSAGNASGAVQIEVLEVPESLFTKPAAVYENGTFTVYGKTKDGYTAEIDLADCAVTDKGKYKEIAFAGAKGIVYKTENTADTFEGTNGKVLVYPAAVQASYSITADKAMSGSNSGMLTFSFDSTAESQAAYVEFSNPKWVQADTDTLGVWVYAPCENYLWLRAEGKTKGGETVRLTLDESMEFSGWQYKTAKLPENVETITRLYVVQGEKKLDISSYILLDNLEFIRGDAELAEAEPAVQAEREEGEFTFAVTSEPFKRNNLLSRVYDAQLSKALNASGAKYHMPLYTNAFSNAYGNNYPIGGMLEQNLKNGFTAEFNEGENAGLMLSANSKGITGANSAQWSKLTALLKGSAKNVFVGLNTLPESLPNRQDEVLHTLLEDAAKTKNVFLFLPGRTNAIEKKNGVTCVYVSGLKYADTSVALDQQNYMCFARVTVSGGEPHVTFEKVYN